MQIISTHNLRRAAHLISIDETNPVIDRMDWEIIGDFIEQDTPEAYERAAAMYRLLDTAARDLLDQYARDDSNVKHEAEAALSIQWRF